MTKHRARADRICEIVEAASEVIDLRGYRNLTMEAVAERISISKAAIYRYFPSKKDLALAVFEAAFSHETVFDQEEVLGRGLSVVDTVLALAVRDHQSDADRRWERVSLQLLPEILHDRDFAALMDRLEDMTRLRYSEFLPILVMQRQDKGLRPEFSSQLELAFRLGSTLMEGLKFRRLAGLRREDEKAMLKLFLDVMLEHALVNHE